ncbi:Neuronal-specific septin-like protein [Emericellopsis cladophorae]|uniref:Neuronal-specific septin-like protein n=1 Tax=Emericellopsis cladophorae TaxID=2686198 RepID=A0A9Q0BAM3_9HYPO|nr:Neuronal-specific septin-like protein [Emericellopsis cladophorae]KAI6777861.1 Neuronal-specific septin-like protein [Emericellopsis cladophorae]
MSESQETRRPSFGMLLKRSKSGEFGSKGRKAQALREAELERQRAAASRIPPKLPEFANHTEQLSKSFGSDLRPDSSYDQSPNARAVASAVPIPPIPANAFDPYARTESMAHRGRYSYASSAVSTINSPRRVRRRKDPTPFNILILGTRDSGKTSFLEFLKTALALPAKKRTHKAEEDDFKMPAPSSGNFIPHFLETEMDGERIGLTLWDSEGLEKNVVDLQLRELNSFLESKFEETFAEEMKVVRSPGVQDTHIHAAFLILDPSRLDRNVAASRSLAGLTNGQAPHMRVVGCLDEDLDMQLLRLLQGKTTVIPVISKADTVATKHMNVLKKAVWETFKQCNLDPLESLGLDEDTDSVTSSRIAEEDEDDVSNASDRAPKSSPPSSPNSKRQSTQSIRRHKAQEDSKVDETPFLPLSIISPDLYEPGVVGRQFPWGFADPYNEDHCDFTRLKEAVFSEWRSELREASREQWYEGWRTSRLKLNQLPHRRR